MRSRASRFASRRRRHLREVGVHRVMADRGDGAAGPGRHRPARPRLHPIWLYGLGWIDCLGSATTPAPERWRPARRRACRSGSDAIPPRRRERGPNRLPLEPCLGRRGPRWNAVGVSHWLPVLREPACVGQQLPGGALFCGRPAVASDEERCPDPGPGARRFRLVWWRCSRNPDHERQASIDARTGPQQGCPFCAARLASVTNSRAARFPAVAARWHPTRNAGLAPDRVVTGSCGKVWWVRLSDPRHECARVVRNMVQSKGCPVCDRERRAVVGRTSANSRSRLPDGQRRRTEAS